MRYLLILLALIVTACTTVKTATAPVQNYRMKGSDQPISITGHITNKATDRAFDTVSDTTMTILFDNELVIQGKLDQRLNGELTGDSYKGKPTAASCNSVNHHKNQYSITCTVFIDNERTVTLTF